MINFLEPENSGPQPTLPKTDDKPLDKYLLNIDRLIKEETETPEAKTRAQTIIQMCRRYRGSTPSDLFGFWRNGVWADSPRFAALHGTNVFQALVHGAEAGYMQAKVALDISAKANNFQNRSVEKIARSIYEVLGKTQWTGKEQAVFHAAMLKLNAFCISRFNKAGGPELPVPQFQQMAYEQGGQWVCPECYTSGEGLSGTEACPACGAPVSFLQDPSITQDYAVSGFGNIPAGETEIIIADGLDVSVDDRSGESADVTKSGWLQWRYFAQKSELKKLYPHLVLKDKPDWSYTTRLKVALKRYESGEAMPKTKLEQQEYEVKQTWLDRTEYEDYVAPVSLQIGDFMIQAGQKLCEVCPDGLVMGVVNNELAFIDKENKNKRVKSCVWLTDPTSFYGLGARAGLSIQKKINQLDNMAMEGEARSMKGSVVYVPEAIDGANLEGANTNIPLRPDFATGGDPLKNFIMPIEVSGLSAASLSFLGTQVDTMQRVMGIPDVTLGEGDANIKTATGQQLVSQRASGLMIPAKISEGNMKIGWLWDQLDLIQTYYSPEALLKFGSRYGEEWMDDEVMAFFEAKLPEAVAIELVEGSEIPESRADKQNKLRADIANGFIPMTPELQMKLAQQSGYDGMDINNYESNCKLADKRLNALKEVVADPQLEMAYQMAEMAMIDKKSGMRMPGPNPVLMQLLSDPIFMVNSQAENHQQHIDYWSRKYREFMASGKTQPQVLVAACDMLITKHKEGIFVDATQAQTLMGISQMPMQAGAQLTAQALTPPEPETKEKS
jgi:hypothetical protein